MKSVQQYGLKEGKPFHISKVENGLKCGCICPACEVPLIARNNVKNKKNKHFAHQNGEECRYGVETALHYAAKEIISKTKKFVIPSKNFYFTHHDFLNKEQNEKYTNFDLGESVVVIEEKEINVDKVELEKRIHDFVPDIIIKTGGKELLVEIAVTHFVDDVKLEKIKKANLSLIEIDLSSFYGELTNEKLEDILCGKSSYDKEWMHNTKWDELKEKAKKRAGIRIVRKVNALEKHERDRKEQIDYERKVFYENNYTNETEKKLKELYEKFYKRIESREKLNKAGFIGPNVLIQETDSCPLKKREFNGHYYANIKFDCERCSNYRGRRKNDTC